MSGSASHVRIGVIFLAAGLTAASTGASAQHIPATAPSQASAPAATTPAAGMQSPSALLQPGIDSLRSALTGVRLDKWKAAEAVRDEADANLNSIRRDLDATLPGLLAAADAAPNSVARVLPAYRNVEALYDVLLRVAAAARMAAPSQGGPLDQALLSLDAGRRGLGDRLQLSGTAVEKQVNDLQASLKAAQAAPVQTASTANCPAAPPAPKKKKTTAARKPAPAPAN